MDLWTEYEGLTVDGSFPLNKLLQPEGRSAFFATSNDKGEAILIRLIECHFDEEEILARWRGVQALGHPNFLRIDRFGQLLIDDTTVVYAAFEKVDTDLETVLDEGNLSPEDAWQIGTSLVSALETLHAHGFMHDHVEARNVYAVGDAVKLRSDCIRETPEGDAGEQGRRRDVQGLAALLKHVLLGTRRFRRVHVNAPLPSPFEEIVHNGTSGLWGLKEIRAALTPVKAAPVAEPVKSDTNKTIAPKGTDAADKTPRAAAGPRAAAAVTGGVNGGVNGAAKAASDAEKPFSFKNRPKAVEQTQTARPTDSEKAPRARFLEGSTPFQHSGFAWPGWLRDPQNMARRWVMAGALAVLIVLVGFICLHWIFKAPAPATHHVGATSAPAGKHSESAAGGAARRDSASQPDRAGQVGSAAQASAPSRGAAAGRTEWRVVAFTYNQESQARKKASSLVHSHPDLKADVFSPTGRAPWLVTVGGSMQREEAYALARRARSLGLPRDTYAQNYSAR